MRDLTPEQSRRVIDTAFWCMVIITVGLLVVAMSACTSTSTITPATSAATRTTESKGPRTTLRVRSIPPTVEAK